MNKVPLKSILLNSENLLFCTRELIWLLVYSGSWLCNGTWNFSLLGDHLVTCNHGISNCQSGLFSDYLRYVGMSNKFNSWLTIWFSLHSGLFHYFSLPCPSKHGRIVKQRNTPCLIVVLPVMSCPTFCQLDFCIKLVLQYSMGNSHIRNKFGNLLVYVAIEYTAQVRIYCSG